MSRTTNEPHPITTGKRPKASDGLSVASTRDGDVLLPERTVRETLLGGASHMMIRRRLREDPSFPQLVRIGRRRHFWRNDILRWLGSDAAQRPLKKVKPAQEAVAR